MLRIKTYYLGMSCLILCTNIVFLGVFKVKASKLLNVSLLNIFELLVVTFNNLKVHGSNAI